MSIDRFGEMEVLKPHLPGIHHLPTSQHQLISVDVDNVHDHNVTPPIQCYEKDRYFQFAKL